MWSPPARGRAAASAPAQQGDFPTFEDGAHLAHLCRAVERSARENGVWADV